MKRAHLYVVMVLAALIAGCGGSGYTKHDFVARADAICASTLRQTRSIAPGTALSTYLAKYVPVLEAEESQLRALRRPPGTANDRATLDRYFAALSQAVADYRRLAAAAKRGDAQAVSDAEASLGSSQVYALAASYGLSSCGTPGATVA